MSIRATLPEARHYRQKLDILMAAEREAAADLRSPPIVGRTRPPPTPGDADNNHSSNGSGDCHADLRKAKEAQAAARWAKRLSVEDILKHRAGTPTPLSAASAQRAALPALPTSPGKRPSDSPESDLYVRDAKESEVFGKPRHYHSSPAYLLDASGLSHSLSGSVSRPHTAAADLFATAPLEAGRYPLPSDSRPLTALVAEQGRSLRVGDTAYASHSDRTTAVLTAQPVQAVHDKWAAKHPPPKSRALSGAGAAEYSLGERFLGVERRETETMRRIAETYSGNLRAMLGLRPIGTGDVFAPNEGYKGDPPAASASMSTGRGNADDAKLLTKEVVEKKEEGVPAVEPATAATTPLTQSQHETDPPAGDGTPSQTHSAAMSTNNAEGGEAPEQTPVKTNTLTATENEDPSFADDIGALPTAGSTAVAQDGGRPLSRAALEKVGEGLRLRHFGVSETPGIVHTIFGYSPSRRRAGANTPTSPEVMARINRPATVEDQCAQLLFRPHDGRMAQGPGAGHVTLSNGERRANTAMAATLHHKHRLLQPAEDGRNTAQPIVQSTTAAHLETLRPPMTRDDMHRLKCPAIYTPMGPRSLYPGLVEGDDDDNDGSKKKTTAALSAELIAGSKSSRRRKHPKRSEAGSAAGTNAADPSSSSSKKTPTAAATTTPGTVPTGGLRTISAPAGGTDGSGAFVTVDIVNDDEAFPAPPSADVSESDMEESMDVATPQVVSVGATTVEAQQDDEQGEGEGADVDAEEDDESPPMPRGPVLEDAAINATRPLESLHHMHMQLDVYTLEDKVRQLQDEKRALIQSRESVLEMRRARAHVQQESIVELREQEAQLLCDVVSSAGHYVQDNLRREAQSREADPRRTYQYKHDRQTVWEGSHAAVAEERARSLREDMADERQVLEDNTRLAIFQMRTAALMRLDTDVECAARTALLNHADVAWRILVDIMAHTLRAETELRAAIAAEEKEFRHSLRSLRHSEQHRAECATWMPSLLAAHERFDKHELLDDHATSPARARTPLLPPVASATTTASATSNANGAVSTHGPLSATSASANSPSKRCGTAAAVSGPRGRIGGGAMAGAAVGIATTSPMRPGTSSNPESEMERRKRLLLAEATDAHREQVRQGWDRARSDRSQLLDLQREKMNWKQEKRSLKKNFFEACVAAGLLPSDVEVDESGSTFMRPPSAVEESSPYRPGSAVTEADDDMVVFGLSPQRAVSGSPMMRNSSATTDTQQQQARRPSTAEDEGQPRPATADLLSLPITPRRQEVLRLRQRLEYVQWAINDAEGKEHSLKERIAAQTMRGAES